VTQLWTPVPEGPHEVFVDRLHRSIAHFAEVSGVETPLVEIELADRSRFRLVRIEPEPGFGMVTVYVQPIHDPDGPDAIIVPLGTIHRIELRSAPDEEAQRFGFSVPSPAE
jgi:hypothetical protein